MVSVSNSVSGLEKMLPHFRRLKNFSQETRSKASGVSIRTIQRIETGESAGSAYTLGKLADALNIDVALLTEGANTESIKDSATWEKLKLLNLSSLAVLLLPLSNIVFPVIILWKNKDNTKFLQPARRIISAQLLWTFCTILFMILIPLLLLLFKIFQGNSIPLFIPVYYTCVFVNVYYTLKISVAISKQQPFLNRIPTIL